MSVDKLALLTNFAKYLDEQITEEIEDGASISETVTADWLECKAVNYSEICEEQS
jgi:hypothetical protein